MAGQAINQLVSTASSIIKSGGKALLHSKFPNDFEYYLCVFEIIDSDTFQTLEYFAFPIMPQSISIQDSKVQTITKTFNGIVVIENNSFTPKKISLNGNFGKNVKLVNLKSPEEQGWDISIGGVNIGETPLPTVTTGYGITKRLQRILENSSLLNNNKPVMLMFYCFANNSQYLVQIDNFRFEQNRSMNMIWEYSINLTAIANASDLLFDDTLKNKLNDILKQDFVKNSIKAVANFAGSQTKVLKTKLINQVNEALT